MEKFVEGGEEQVVNEIKNCDSPRSEKKTPRRRLIQSTLFPLKPHEKVKEKNNGGKEDEEHCGSQSNGKRKRKPKITSSPAKVQENNYGQGKEDVDEGQRGSQSNGKKKRKPKITSSPAKVQEDNNGEGKEYEDEEQHGSQISPTKKRTPKFTPSPAKSPTNEQEVLSLGIESKNYSLVVDKLGVVNGGLPPLEKKTPCRRLVQSTLVPQQANGEDNNVDDDKEDEECCGSPTRCKMKSEGKEQTVGHTLCAKTPIDNQDALIAAMESKGSMLTDGLQPNLVEKSAEAEEIVAVNGSNAYLKKITPRRRLVQSTLLPHSSHDGEENNNSEEDREDGNWCGSQSKGKEKRKAKAKSKRTPTTKTPVKGQEVLEGEHFLLTNGWTVNNGVGPSIPPPYMAVVSVRNVKQKQQNDQKVADSPDGSDKPCTDLESRPCKRSRRQLKKGQSEDSPRKVPTPRKLKGQSTDSPRKVPTPRKLKGQSDDSPRKTPTPRKLKGPQCRRIMTEFNETQSECAREPIDLRLEAKLAAEENARLFAGRPTHPFFSSWKVGKSVQQTTGGTGAESSRCSTVQEDHSVSCRPIHVFDMLQDDPVPLDWSNWSFCDRSLLDLSYNPENAHSSCFNGSIDALKLDDLLITSDPVGSFIPQNGDLLNFPYSNYLKSPEAPVADRGVSHQPEQLETYQETINSMDIEQRDNFVEERVKRYYRECGPENSLWTNKYLPRNASEVCGNGDAVRFINEWLGSWRERYFRNPNNYTGDSTCITEASDYILEESDSDAESTEEKTNLKNVLLVSGPVGSGKSAAIYACAREQWFQVIEVSASDWRNGAQIKQKFGAAMESLGLNKWSSEEPLSSGMKRFLGFSSSQTSKLATPEFVNDIVEVLSDESDILKPEAGVIDVKDNSPASCRGADKTLILFEDVDMVFDEDRGLIASIQQIAETAKRPIILTSNRKDRVLPDQLDRLEVHFTIPSPEDLVSHIYTVCASEKAELHPELLRRFIKCCQGDIRKSIMLLQFWCQGRMDEKDRKVQSKYGPLRFDLDAGHRVIPNIIPWGFPCQLSELVEKEITNSLSKVNDNALLPDIVEEEENLSSQEMHDTVAAKKKLMLSRNSSIPDLNEFSTPLDCLDDFSNSSGSPVASPHGSRRRRLRKVMSSQSEDEFITDNIPKDSIQDMFDCCPTETDQQRCETYKSVDVSCVAESSYVPETEINNGVDLLSNISSCGHTESMSFIDASTLHETNETILGNTCEAVANEEIGDSQNEHAESITKRYQALDECSRAGFNLSSESYPKLIPGSSSVSETWRRLRCCHEDLKSYITPEQRNASRIVKLSCGLTDLLSLADLMYGRCQPLLNDLLESSEVPYTEPNLVSWYDEHVEMASTITEHGFCFYKNESTSRDPNSGSKVRADLGSEIVSSTTNTTLLGKLLMQSSSTSHNSFSNMRPSTSEISTIREVIETRVYNTMQNVVPLKMQLGLKGGAFHEYMSSLGRISKLEASRLSENIETTTLRRKGRVARHYLSNGSLMLSSEDVTLLARHSCYGNTQLE